MTKKIDVSKIDAVVIPRNLTPPCTVKAVLNVLIEVFERASSSYTLDKSPCEETVLIDQEYKQIFEGIQKEYNRKNFVYVTEMPFFIILHRVEAPDALWYIMITNVMKLVKEGHYDAHTKTRNLHGGVVTIPYDMKKMKKQLDKKVKVDGR